MRRIRIIGLALVAVFAVSAVASSTASAHRTWWYCVAGTPEDKTCPNAGEKSERIPVGKVEAITAKIKAGTEAELSIETILGTATVKCKKIALKEAAIFNHEGPTGWDKGKIAFTECSAGICGKPTEPINVPTKGPGESVLAEKEKEQAAGKPIYDVSLPSEGSKVFSEVVTPNCGTIVVETEPAVGRQGAAQEGEGGTLGEIVEAEKYKLVHVFKYVCEPKRVWNWHLKEIKVNELTKKGCFKAEAEVELTSKKAYDAK